MLSLLDPNEPKAHFPPVEEAEDEPNGLLAVGGDLSLPRLLNAYRSGIFPWYSDDQPILWWSPDPRTVLFPERLRISRSLRKTLRKRGFLFSVDNAFPRVIQACAAPRDGAGETWITEEMLIAYEALHQEGYAHSVEVWESDRLVGGLYGIAIGRVFFGESMFSDTRDASKAALAYLAHRIIAWGYPLIDCQVYSRHLISLGAEQIRRHQFSEYLRQWCHETPKEGTGWRAQSPSRWTPT